MKHKIPKKIKKLIKVARKNKVDSFCRKIKNVSYGYYKYDLGDHIEDHITVYTKIELKKEKKL